MEFWSLRTAIDMREIFKWDYIMATESTRLQIRVLTPDSLKTDYMKGKEFSNGERTTFMKESTGRESGMGWGNFSAGWPCTKDFGWRANLRATLNSWRQAEWNQKRVGQNWGLDYII